MRRRSGRPGSLHARKRYYRRAIDVNEARYGSGTNSWDAVLTVHVLRVELAGNHIHLLVTFPTRASMRNFLRRLAACVACSVMGGRRGESRARFWLGRPFSRVVLGGEKAFWRAESYVILNELEAIGILPPRWMARLGPPGDGKRMRLLRTARLFENELE